MTGMTGAEYSKQIATVGTTNVNVPHYLSTTPDFVILTVTGTVAGVVRAVSRDATNVVVVSTLANTVVEIVAVV